MTTQDLWYENRVWTVNFATSPLADDLMAQDGGQTQLRLCPIFDKNDSDVIVGYDVDPIDLPEAWTLIPTRLFCFGSIEPQWPHPSTFPYWKRSTFGEAEWDRPR